MSTITVQNLTKQLGDRVILDDASLELHGGHVVGLVGPNGAGKTTLFRLITGELQPDRGTVTRSRGLDIGYLPQHPQVGLGNTVHDEVMSAFAPIFDLEQRMHTLSDEIAARHDDPDLPRLMSQYDKLTAEFDAAGGYGCEQRLDEILGGLGFSIEDYKLPMTALSGGQKCRVALAKLLLQESQFLLLDEPTNHLDIDAVRWLEKFLASHRGGAVVISHDRYLLDRVADRIVECDRAQLKVYNGNYSTYAETKAVERLTRERQFEKDQEFIEKEREFIRRFLAGQRSKEAQGRRTRLERRIKAGEFVLERPDDVEQFKLGFKGADAIEGRTVLQLHGLSKRFDEKVLFADLSLNVQGGQRLGVTGPNGTGKSMLLKAALGIVAPDAGDVSFDSKADIGYYAQDTASLDPEHTILEEIRAVAPGMSEQSIRGLLGRFLFTGDDVFKRIGLLSGGEKSRVRLICLILSSPNILILDEPTNHLDIPSREALEEALTEYPGTLIAVSHDRYFLDRLVDRLLVMRDGRHRLFDGNYSAYIAQFEREEDAARLGKDSADRASRQRAGADPRKERTARQTRPKLTGPYAKTPLPEIESLIAKREQSIREMTDRFADPVVCRDPAKLAQLQSDFDAARADLAALEQAWLARADAS